MKVVYYEGGNARRSRAIAEAWKAGLARHGVALRVLPQEDYDGPEADVAIFYGLQDNLKRALKDYPAAGAKAVFLDLGYWGRLDGGKLAGFHRIAVNGPHATAYFQRVKHPADRWRYFNIEPKAVKRAGRHVLLAGMSRKSAWVYDLAAEQWERAAALELARHTAREVWYRPKPSWKEASPIAGTVWMQRRATDPLPLEDCWAVVTHHSHAALEALVAGVPAFVEDGLALPLARMDLGSIEAPLYPDEAAREQLLCDVAYTQYKVSEIADGKAWRYLREEGLV